jgi:hypothetical protein
MSTENELPPVVPDGGWDLSDGRYVRYYRAGEWVFSIIEGGEPVLDGDDDSSIAYAHASVAAWTAWAQWLTDRAAHRSPQPPDAT